MHAVVPPIITDISALIGFAMLVIAFSIAVAKIKWLRRLYNYLVIAPLSNWFRGEVTDANRPLETKIDTHIEYVRYHLGPNGDTVPIHERLIALETRFSIDTETGEWPDPQPPADTLDA